MFYGRSHTTDGWNIMKGTLCISMSCTSWKANSELARPNVCFAGLAPTPAFHSESKTFGQFRFCIKTVRCINGINSVQHESLRPVLQDIVVNFRVWQAKSHLLPSPSCKDILLIATSASIARSTSFDKVGKELYCTSSRQKQSQKHLYASVNKNWQNM